MEELGRKGTLLDNDLEEDLIRRDFFPYCSQNSLLSLKLYFMNQTL